MNQELYNRGPDQIGSTVTPFIIHHLWGEEVDHRTLLSSKEFLGTGDRRWTRA